MFECVLGLLLAGAGLCYIGTSRAPASVVVVASWMIGLFTWMLVAALFGL